MTWGGTSTGIESGPGLRRR